MPLKRSRDVQVEVESADSSTQGWGTGSIANKITWRMVLIAAIPLLVIGALVVAASLVAANRASSSVDTGREVLLEDVIAEARIELAEQFIVTSAEFTSNRFDDSIDWSRAAVIVDAAGESRPEISQFVALPVALVEEEFDGTDVLDTSGRSSQFLRDQVADRPEYLEVFFTDINGFNVGATGPTSDFVQRDEEWWQSAWEDGAFLGPVEFDESAQGRSFEVAIRIDDPRSGRPLGVLKAVVDAQAVFALGERFADSNDRDLRNLTLIASDGTLILETATGNDPNRIGQRVEYEGDRKESFDLVLGLREPTGFFLFDESIIAYAKSEPLLSLERLGLEIPNNEWIVLVDQPLSTATEPFSELEDLSSELDDVSRFTLPLMALILAATVALTAVAARLVARRISTPIGRLSVEANRVADDELPELVEKLRVPGSITQLPEVEAIDVEADGEVAELVHALNAMRSTAIELAGDQAIARNKDVASVLVNLGRRNRQLVGRQLQFIEELEQTESDPDTLDSLFRLDQMATRMRRNAESLLVLSGEAPLRRSGEAMAIDDVIRAASGEIEDYLRVQVDNVDPVYVHPSAASDLVHLMAELLENATNFSSPDQMIRIVGVTQVDGSYTISIIDQGIGMSRSEMAEVNDRLIEPSFKDDSPAGLLGLFVVGRLALRHGIDARLVESATAGVTAKLTLPAVIVILEGEVLDGDPVQNLISTLNEMEEPRPAMRAPAHPPEEFRLPRETVATDRQQMPDRMEFERQQSHALEVKVRRRTRTTDDETSDSTSTDGERVQLVDTARREPGPHVRAEPGAARAEQTRQDLDNFASGVEAARKATRPAPGEQPSNAVAGPADPGNEERIGRASRPNRRSTDWEDDHG